jgi:putative phosphoribosyl transferase
MSTLRALSGIDVPVLFDGEITVPVNGDRVGATLTIPRRALGLVLFAHGSGNCRISPHNREVINGLNAAGFATLLPELLTYDEEIIDRATARFRFDAQLLGERLASVTEWAASDGALSHMRIGYFGVSTGAAAALIAAAALPTRVRAVVSRGGRTDLADLVLARTRAATLLIAGEQDRDSVALNQQAHTRLGCEKAFVVVPGGADGIDVSEDSAAVELLARDWFTRNLSDVPLQEPISRPAA